MCTEQKVEWKKAEGARPNERLLRVSVEYLFTQILLSVYFFICRIFSTIISRREKNTDFRDTRSLANKKREILRGKKIIWFVRIPTSSVVVVHHTYYADAFIIRQIQPPKASLNRKHLTQPSIPTKIPPQKVRKFHHSVLNLFSSSPGWHLEHK